MPATDLLPILIAPEADPARPRPARSAPGDDDLVRASCRRCSRPCMPPRASASPHRRSATACAWPSSTCSRTRSRRRSTCQSRDRRRQRRTRHPRGGLPLPARPIRRRDPAGPRQSPLPRPRGRAAGDRGRRPARRLPAARDRPSRRHPVRRPPLRAQAQHDHAPPGQGPAARSAGEPSRETRLPGQPGFVAAGAARPARRARDRRRLLPAAPPRRPRPGADPLPGRRRSAPGSACPSAARPGCAATQSALRRLRRARRSTPPSSSPTA